MNWSADLFITGFIRHFCIVSKWYLVSFIYQNSHSIRDNEMSALYSDPGRPDTSFNMRYIY